VSLHHYSLPRHTHQVLVPYLWLVLGIGQYLLFPPSLVSTAGSNLETLGKITSPYEERKEYFLPLQIGGLK